MNVHICTLGIPAARRRDEYEGADPLRMSNVHALARASVQIPFLQQVVRFDQDLLHNMIVVCMCVCVCARTLNIVYGISMVHQGHTVPGS